MQQRPSWYRRYFRFPLNKRQIQVDLDEELRFHLEMRTAKLIEQGLTPEDAAAEARRRFGSLAKIRRECLQIDQQRHHIMRLKTWWDELRLDVAHALRSLLKEPTFTLTAVLALAIGIGATTALFSLLDAVVLRPWPIPQAERVQFVAPTTTEGWHGVSPGLAFAWAENTRSFEEMAPFYELTLNLTGDASPERISGRAVSAAYFRVLEVPTALGRFIFDDDDRPESAKVVVLSHGLWARRFGSELQILGRDITLNGETHTVVGVMPQALDLDASSPEVFVPLALPDAQRDNFGGNYLAVLGRLADGIDRETARSELIALVERLDLRNSTSGELYGVALTPLNEMLVEDHAKRLWILFGAVLLVLLITCSNVASLLLARCASRAQELAIRASLGAGRARIAKQLMNESLVLAAVGALLGVFFAHLGLDILRGLIPTEIPRLHQAQIDDRALAFTLLLTLLTSLLFGMAPAWRSSRIDLQAVMNGGGRLSGLDNGRDPLRGVFVAAQVALSLLLLTGAGLLLHSAILLQQVAPGYQAENVLTAEMKLPENDYPELGRALVTYQEILERINAAPGFESVALGSSMPLAGSTTGSDFAREGQPLAPGTQVQSRMHLVSPGYFTTLGIPLRAGRDFSQRDHADAARAVIVNETLARQLGIEAPGDRIYTDTFSFIDETGQPYLWQIVGIATDIKDRGLRADPMPAVYLPLAQAPSAPWTWTGRRMLLAARTSLAPKSLIADLRTTVANVDSSLPLYNIQTLEERLIGSLASERFNTFLLSGLGLIGLFLAALGIYGLVAFFVGQRRQEMGIRLALGATIPSLHRLVIERGMRPALAGLAIGLFAAIALSSVLESQLFGIAPSDPFTYIVASLILTLMALTACYLPARKAVRTDPRQVLRAQ